MTRSGTSRAVSAVSATDVPEREHLALACRGAFYVALQACGVSAIAHGSYVLAIAVGFLISLTWSYNVKSLALSTTGDRIAYSAGAALGTGVGMWLGGWLR